ncbi:MAG: flavin reductase family protein [Candidatus Margulisiibacteriota bacterium]
MAAKVRQTDMASIEALNKINYVFYIVSSKAGEKLNGQIANTVFQVAAEPAKIAVCINKQNLTHQYISDGNIFSVSILSQEAPMTFIGKFGFKSGRDTNKFEGTGYRARGTGSPVILDHTVGFIEAKVVSSCDVGTHTLFVGEVVDSEVFNDKEPMTYDYYRKYLKGKTPKTAATYQAQEK